MNTALCVRARRHYKFLFERTMGRLSQLGKGGLRCFERQKKPEGVPTILIILKRRRGFLQIFLPLSQGNFFDFTDLLHSDSGIRA